MAGQQEDPELRRILEAEVQRAQFQQQALGLTGELGCQRLFIFEITNN